MFCDGKTIIFYLVIIFSLFPSFHPHLNRALLGQLLAELLVGHQHRLLGRWVEQEREVADVEVLGDVSALHLGKLPPAVLALRGNQAIIE